MKKLSDADGEDSAANTSAQSGENVGQWKTAE